MTLTELGLNTFAGARADTVVTLPITDSTTLTAGEFVELSSGKLITSVTDLSSALVGVANTTKTMGVLTTAGLQQYMGVITEGLIKVKGLVHGSSGTYTSALAIGTKVSLHYDATAGYGQFAVNSDSNAIGIIVEGSVASSGSTDDQWDYVLIQLDFEVAGGGTEALIPSVFTKTITFNNASKIDTVAGKTGAFIETGTYSSLADGGIILSSTNARPNSFLADDSGSNIATSARNVLARTLLTVSQSGGSIRSLMGQLKLLDAVDLATGVYTGVQGYVELAGDTEISSGAKASGMDISVEIASGKTLTIASGGLFAGLHIETTGAGSIAATGDMAAIYIDDGGTVDDWPVGIDINNCAIGIDVGAATTGINISGATADGIIIAGTCSDNAIEISGAVTGSAIQVITGGFAIGLEIDADGTTAIDVTSNFTGTTMLNLAGTAADAIVISGACTDNGIEISGACTGSAIEIVTGGFGIGVNVNADGTTGVAVSSAFSGTTMLELAGTGTAGILISGACTEAIDITGTATTAINVDTGTFTTGLSLGGTLTTGVLITGASGYAIDVVTSGQFRMGVQGTGIPTVTATPFAMEIHSETGGDLTAGGTGLTCGIRSRYEVSVAQTNQISFASIDARLRVKEDLADGSHAGIRGTIEASESKAFGGTGTTSRSGGEFTLDFSAGTTISTGWLAGITIDSSVDGSISMASCTFVGARIKAGSGKEAFEHGIYIDDDSAVTGITLGTMTSGIDIGVCTGTGIDIEGSLKGISATTTITGASALNANSFTVTDSTTGSSGYAVGLKVAYTAGGAKTGTAEANGASIDMSVTGDTPFARALTLYTVTSGTTTVGTSNALDIYMDDDASTVTQTGKRAINIGIDHGEDKGIADMIVMRCHGGTVDNVFKFTDTSGTPYTNLISIDGVVGFASVDAGTPGANSTHKLKVDMGGTAGYIAVYADY